jgi:cytochrome c2
MKPVKRAMPQLKQPFSHPEYFAKKKKYPLLSNLSISLLLLHRATGFAANDPHKTTCMKRISVFLIACFIFLFSCTQRSKNSPTPFTSAMLARQDFSINADKDTQLVTLHGSLVHIPAGAFNSSVPVSIEIREAFTPSEIFAAGLSTESNGRLLRSAGMIYINAMANGDSVDLLKPIDVSIPNNYYDEEMQVYKGVETDSGTVNWADPQPTDTTPQSKDWLAGQQLFKANCSSCHKIGQDMTGPDLRGIEKRWQNHSHLKQWIKNWPVAVAAGWPEAIRAQYLKGTAMNSFEFLTDRSLNQLIGYITNESLKSGPVSLTETIDTIETYNRPCPDDTIYIPLPIENTSFLDTNDYSEETVVLPEIRDTTKRKLIDTAFRRGGLNDPNPTAGMYDFTINALGWYNIDAGMEGYEGTTVVKVFAQLQDDFNTDLHVYLFCPDKKILSVGNEQNGNTYSFNKIEGGVPLFIGDRAILFAFGSKDDKMYYGISEFTINNQQTIPVIIKPTTGDEIRQALLSKQMSGIDIGIDKKEMKIVKNPCDYAKRDTVVAPDSATK